MVEIEMRYAGGLRCQASHGPSGTKLTTDAPVDNLGKGESFSPTDLLATALGTCMLTTMGILAKRRGWTIDGLELVVQKHMSTQPPRRVARLPIRFSVPREVAAALDAPTRADLEAAAHTCPVALSLHESVEVVVDFGW